MNAPKIPVATTTAAPVNEPPPPPRLPRRFWIAIDGGLLTLDQAVAAWAACEAAGEKFDPLG